MKKASGLTSQVNWLLLNEDDIRNARQVIAAAGPESTVDVLGLGTPVELISDLLFPGTSTLHTELRYVIFVPAIFYAIRENGGVPDAFGTLKRKEAELIKSLLNGGLKEGVIGRTRGESLKYWPSMTYWAGVNSYRAFGKSAYERSQILDALSVQSSKNELVSDEGDTTGDTIFGFEGDERMRAIALSIFNNPKKIIWDEKMDFRLRKIEAKFLRDQIVENHPESLYNDLLLKPKARLSGIDSLFQIKTASSVINELIQNASSYSQVSMGATYAYRWALCDHFESTRKDKILKAEWAAYREKNEELFEEWLLASKSLRSWRVKDLREAVKAAFPKSLKRENPVDIAIERFCDEFLVAALGVGSAKKKLQSIKTLVKLREDKLKGNRSRFRDETIEIPENVRAKPDAEFFNHLYDYRWRWGRDNTISILEGLVRR